MRTRRAFGRLRARLLVFNVLLVLLPASGLLFLDTHERQLLRDQERAMVAQGRVLAAALATRESLAGEAALETLLRLNRGSAARIRVIDPAGRVLADSSQLGPRREPGSAAAGTQASGLQDHWLYRIGAAPFRTWRRWLGFRPASSSFERAEHYVARESLDGPEVRRALAGGYGAASRVSAGDQRSLTLYSALPIRRANETLGAVVVSQSTYQILQALYRLRLDVLQIVLLSIAIAVALSLWMSHTIARPLGRLSDQAEHMLDRRGRLRGRFDGDERSDEIGDLARSLEGLRQRLDTRVGEMERFASDLSHEFRNPLASIRAAAEMLGPDSHDAECQPGVERIQLEVARLERLLAGAREIGRLDAAPLEAAEELDLVELVAGITRARLHRDAGGVRVRAPRRPLWVQAAPEPLARAIENLVDNAASFDADGNVEIELEARASSVILRVLDRGPGVAESERERIFERFYSHRPRVESRRQGALGHTGLGLPIARAIAEQAGGGLVALEREGGGACFELRLPASPSSDSELHSWLPAPSQEFGFNRDSRSAPGVRGPA